MQTRPSYACARAKTLSEQPVWQDIDITPKKAIHIRLRDLIFISCMLLLSNLKGMLRANLIALSKTLARLKSRLKHFLTTLLLAFNNYIYGLILHKCSLDKSHSPIDQYLAYFTFKL